MMARTRPFLLVLLLLPLPLPGAGASDPGAAGPDEHGAWSLAFDVSRAEAGAVTARLEIVREDADGARSATREIGERELPAGDSRQEFPFLPAEGAGRYTVALVLDGVRADEVAFDVEEAGASREIAFDVADEPTWLNITDDEVNAPGKLKSPGEALITRATLSDANGLTGFDGVRWSLERGGLTIDSGTLPLTAPADATSAPVELRYDRAPLAAGSYVLRLAANERGGPVAQTVRTFAIREVTPTFVSGSIPDVIPDEGRVVTAIITLADRNGAVGPGALDPRVYRGSSRAEGAGVTATLGAPTALPDVAGAARWAYPLELRIPARAPPGTLRVSLYHNDSLLSALPFEVRALPSLRSVVSSVEAGRLVLSANATGDGILTAKLRDAAGTEVSTVSADLTARIELDPPKRGEPLRWTLELRARAGGPVLAERNGSWTAPLGGPEIRLTLAHPGKRLPATWVVEGADVDIEAAQARVVFTRWDGANESALSARFANGRVRVDGPRDLPAGRYHAHLVLTWPNGTASEARWEIEAGPWIELTLGAPIVDATEARVPVENVGGLSISRLVVEATPPARVSLRVGNATFVARDIGGRQVFSGFALAPGELGELHVALPPGPRAAGRASVALRVMARLGSA